VNDRTWFRAMVTRTCSVQSALQHACRVLFLVHVQHVGQRDGIPVTADSVERTHTVRRTTAQTTPTGRNAQLVSSVSTEIAKSWSWSAPTRHSASAALCVVAASLLRSRAAGDIVNPLLTASGHPAEAALEIERADTTNVARQVVCNHIQRPPLPVIIIKSNLSVVGGEGRRFCRQH